ncbi:MAG: oligosaccharide flippase family protein [Roseibium sp.]|nr:oligosaccharide flippase family protein [Roseibium sp.]
MHSLISASLFVSASGILSLIAGFISSIVIARMLGAEGTGLTALALWVAITGAIVAGRGIPAVILRYISRQKDTAAARNGLVKIYYLRYMWPVLLVSSLFLAYGLYTHVTVDTNSAFVWIIAGVTCIAYAQGHFVIAAEHGLGQFPKAAKKTALGSVLQIPVTFVGAFLFGPAGAMLGYLARHLPQAFGLKQFRHPVSTEDAEISDQMVRYGNSNWISIILDSLIKTRVELVFIGLFFTVVDVGYFAAAVTFSSLILQLSFYMAAGLTPGFGKLYDDKATEQLKISYDRSLRWLSLLLLPVSLGGAVVMFELIPFAFGQEFLPAAPIAFILVFFSLPQALYSVPLAAMLAFENDRRLLFMNSVAAASLIMLNLVFTPMFGGMGAAVIRGVVGVAIFVWLAMYCYRRLGLAINLGAQFRILISGLACAASAWFILQQIGGLAGLAIAIPVAAIVYVVLLRLTRSIPDSDLKIIQNTFENHVPARFKPILKPALSVLGSGSTS